MQHTSDNRKILTCTLLHVFDIYLSYQFGRNSLDHIMEIIKINVWAVERSRAILIANAIIARPFCAEVSLPFHTISTFC